MEPHRDQRTFRKIGNELPSDGPKPPPLGSPARTSGMVEAHFRICREDNRGIKPRSPSSFEERELAAVARQQYQALLVEHANCKRFTPTRTFVHSERVVSAPSGKPLTINFLAEARNAAGDFIVLSHQGWSLHPFNCPCFSHVQVSAAAPNCFDMLKLYSQDAFQQEIRSIRRQGMELLLGLQHRSFIIEECLSAIEGTQGFKRLEPSSIRQIDVTAASDREARLLFTSSTAGRTSLSVSLVPGYWNLRVTASTAR